MIVEFGLLILCAICGIYFIIARRRISPNVRLEGSHVLITGGSSGIGLAVAKYCAKRGAKITLVARDKKKLAEAKLLIGSESGDVYTISRDLSASYSDVVSVIAEAVEQSGPIDILYNCAGTSVAREFALTDPEVIDKMIRTNYTSAAYITRAALPAMIERKRGIVVLTSSQAGQVGIYGFAAYAASKFALRGMAEALYMEMIPHGVSVSLVFPADTDTPGYAVEQIGKPAATHEISQTSGMMTADVAASSIMPQILSGKFFCSVSFDGWLISTVTAGMGPPSGIFQTLAEVTLNGFFRFISLFYYWWFCKVVRQNMGKTVPDA